MAATKELTGYGLYSHSDIDKRAIAVAAALNIIEAKVANSPNNNAIVADELESLSKYADLIQAALVVAAK